MLINVDLITNISNPKIWEFLKTKIEINLDLKNENSDKKELP